MYQGEPVTLEYAKEKYQKNANYALSLNDFDTAFYGQAADQLYAKFISSNDKISDAEKNNYKNLLAANITYLEYARLHGYSEANTNPGINDLIKRIVDGQVAASTRAASLLNMLKNGDFEASDSNWILRHVGDGAREQIASASGTFKCASDASTKCLKLSANKGTYLGASQIFSGLEAGKKYRLSADFRTGETGGTAEINIYDRKNSKEYQLYTPGNTTWKRISVEVPVKEADNEFEVIAYGDDGGRGDGDIYWDNITFEKIAE
jgi:hypothetical protein